LAIKEAYYGKNHWHLAATLGSLANAHGSLGNTHQRKLLLERALAIQEMHYGKDHWQLAATLGSLGNAHGDLGNVRQQKALLERALSIKEKHYGKEHWQVAITLANLANAYGDLGDPRQKKALLERALSIQEKHYGKDHWQVALMQAKRGIVRWDLDDKAGGCEDLKKAYSILQESFGGSHPNTKSVKQILEQSCPNNGKGFFGQAHAEEIFSIKSPTQLLSQLNDHDIKPNKIKKDEFASTFGLLSVLGVGSLLYKKYKSTNQTPAKLQTHATIWQHNQNYPISTSIFPNMFLKTQKREEDHLFTTRKLPNLHLQEKSNPMFSTMPFNFSSTLGRKALSVVAITGFFYTSWHMLTQRKQQTEVPQAMEENIKIHR
jgi:tetratricopeptide (TPR) repeat protein